VQCYFCRAAKYKEFKEFAAAEAARLRKSDFTRHTLDDGSSSQAAKHAAKCGRLLQFLVGGLPDLRRVWGSGVIGS
jgi:hypothetical protein